MLKGNVSEIFMSKNLFYCFMFLGDKTFDVPNLNNYVLPKVIVSPNEDFFANFTDVLLTGLDTASVKDVKYESIFLC